jgi:5'-methylthioadenosine phosphorylase
LQGCNSADFTNPDSALFAVIGGSGFYALDGLSDLRRVQVKTPFGATSDYVHLGTLNGTRLAFIARHGSGHRLLPGEVPYRANVWALASLGVRMLVSVSAVGSLKPELEPRHFVIPDQVVDRTSSTRPGTFFGQGIAAHVSFDEPYCARLSASLAGAARLAGADVHEGGSMLTIEGPAFSSRAESVLYQSWGASVIGMTALPEAKLAREAGMCYACLTCVTDYDTWHPDHSSVSVELVLRNLTSNAAVAKRSVELLARALPDWQTCACCASLSQAIVTDLALVSEETKQRLAPILARYRRLTD